MSARAGIEFMTWRICRWSECAVRGEPSQFGLI
jgi:hypothetical protein